ncbi:adenosylcobinamide-phosphate synthase [Desulfocucumis palustris]|uniref:Cobalamin biosynthesis protein CobD n=1 Tax=Desulfocucumis palustris TaxID=1898651 RepID=A0A2L2XET4_9FIRM|nr:adenosylcobinamide-phosphate synthase CbiB [Desulfocucumis palustris]GBF32746.1 adenosylcobinamide-phosphate synthase [Desulfocucumis palustris]
MNLAIAVSAAYIIDLLVGDPPRLPHPVVFIGRLISLADRVLRPRFKSPGAALCSGALMGAAVVGVSFAATFLLLRLVYAIHPWLGAAAEIWLISTTLAARSLAGAAGDVLKPLREGNLSAARDMVGRIVGRDTDKMDPAGVTRAAVETVAENIVDGVVSPLFYALIGGAPLAMAYKAVNTLDSMVGYRDERYLYFGRFSARLDDLANYIPARLAGLLLVAAAWLSGRNPAGAIRAVFRDAGKHPSPNSGIPESAVAGALGVRLGGLNIYRGRESFRHHMGEPVQPLQPFHIRAAVDLMYLSSLLALLCGILVLQVISSA